MKHDRSDQDVADTAAWHCRFAAFNMIGCVTCMQKASILSTSCSRFLRQICNSTIDEVCQMLQISLPCKHTTFATPIHEDDLDSMSEHKCQMQFSQHN